MISLTYKFNGADLPLTIEKQHLVAFFMEHKGKALELIESLLDGLILDNSELSQMLVQNLLRKYENNKSKNKDSSIREMASI